MVRSLIANYLDLTSNYSRTTTLICLDYSPAVGCTEYGSAVNCGIIKRPVQWDESV